MKTESVKEQGMHYNSKARAVELCEQIPKSVRLLFKTKKQNPQKMYLFLSAFFILEFNRVLGHIFQVLLYNRSSKGVY